MHLFHGTDHTHDYHVIRDAYPVDFSVPLKFFHEWYLKDRSMKAEEGLADLITLIHAKLPKITNHFGLTCVFPFVVTSILPVHYRNPNIYLWSVLIDENFSQLLLIDWSPTDDNSVGVEVKGNLKKLENYYDNMYRFLPQRFSVKTLESVLRAVGKNLRQ